MTALGQPAVPSRSGCGRPYQTFSIDFPQAQRIPRHRPRSRCSGTAYELYRRDDLLSDLVAHFRRQADAATSPVEANYPRLALSSILWWSDDKDEAIAELTRVVEASRPESDLRLDLAELMEQQADYCGIAGDASTPSSRWTTSSLRRREELALRVAVRTGQHRPRPPGGRAALRPPARHRHPDQPVRPDAPARAARAGRGPAGPSPPTCRQQGVGPGRPDDSSTSGRTRLDQAVQVAMQILRTTTGDARHPSRSSPRRGRPDLTCGRPPPASWPDPAGWPSSSIGPTRS